MPKPKKPAEGDMIVKKKSNPREPKPSKCPACGVPRPRFLDNVIVK